MMDAYRQASGVLLVFTLLGVLLWLANRRGLAQWTLHRPGRQKLMSVVETAVLSPQHRVHLLSVDGRRLVLATSPGSCHMLVELSPAAEAQQGEIH